MSHCDRRAQTLYFYNSLHKYNETKNLNYEDALLKEGLIDEEYLKNKILSQGEWPEFKISHIHIEYFHMCPEVNLFDETNALEFAKNTASSSGEWDDCRTNVKFKNKTFKHFSECAEFGNYFTKITGEKIKRKKKRKRVRKAISDSKRFDIFNRDNFTCVYCGANAKDGVALQIDHVIPHSKGGSDEKENLVTSCDSCNRGKSNKLL